MIAGVTEGEHFTSKLRTDGADPPRSALAPNRILENCSGPEDSAEESFY